MLSAMPVRNLCSQMAMKMKAFHESKQENLFNSRKNRSFNSTFKASFVFKTDIRSLGSVVSYQPHFLIPREKCNVWETS